MVKPVWGLTWLLCWVTQVTVTLSPQHHLPSPLSMISHQRKKQKWGERLLELMILYSLFSAVSKMWNNLDRISFACIFFSKMYFLLLLHTQFFWYKFHCNSYSCNTRYSSSLLINRIFSFSEMFLILECSGRSKEVVFSNK